LIEEFSAQAELVSVMFNLISVLMKNTPELAKLLTEYPNLAKMFSMGMIETDNYNLRKKFCMKVSLLVLENSQPTNFTEVKYNLAQKILSTLLFDTIKYTAQPGLEGRCDNFYSSMKEILQFTTANDLEPFQADVLKLIDSLTE
jgi:hypothetical protein